MANFTLGPIAAVCNNNASSWTFNDGRKDPCQVASSLAQACEPGLPPIPPLRQGNAYSGPASPAESNKCICSSVTYSMVAACAYCQSGLFRNWAGDNSWSQNCTPQDLAVGSYPLTIPSNDTVPVWAYLNVSRTNTWDLNEAHQIAGESPDISGTVTPTFSTPAPNIPTGLTLPPAEIPSFSGTSPNTTHKKSEVGPLVGGIIGAVVGLLICVIGAVLFFRHRNRKAKEATPVVTQFVPPPNMTYRGVAQSYGPQSTHRKKPKLYNPSDPSTFPTTLTPSLPLISPSTNMSDRSTSPSIQSSSRSNAELLSPLRTYPNVPNGREWFAPVPEI